MQTVTETTPKSITDINNDNFLELAHSLGQKFATRANSADQNDRFVYENYEDLKAHRLFSAMIPRSLGGHGISHSNMCRFLRIIGGYCASTALAFSMHQHLIAANVWKYIHKGEAAATLQKVAEQQLVLVSTGARDWLESNGKMEKVEGGYLLTAKKAFASQSAIGDIMVTSAPYDDPELGPQVLHFPVPFKAEGVKVLDNWYTMGMRSTGSHTIELTNVFIPETAVALKRPQGEFHMVWNVVLTVAMPLIMSAYTGIAEKAVSLAIKKGKSQRAYKPYINSSIGALHNQLTSTQLAMDDMIRLSNDLQFKPSNELGNAMLTRKTLVANNAIQTVKMAMEIIGGQAFFRNQGFERLFRDVQAGQFHPLPEKDQHLFTGNFLLK